jgi:polynucleotide 5'-hydroxyl-kinase GRC3/NOL9
MTLQALAQDALAWQLFCGGTVYVMGATDRGKTTLCRDLVERMSGIRRTAYIDCDSGQSTIGPPTTLGAAIGQDEHREIYLRFVGTTSPAGHTLPFLTAVKRLQEKVRERGAEVVVIDSPGYIATAAAREFQIQCIQLLRPDHLIAIQADGELEAVLAPFHEDTTMRVHRWPPVPGAQRRTANERRAYRRRAFAEYFAGAQEQQIPLTGLEICGKVPEGGKGLLVAFCDADQFVCSLGVVLAWSGESVGVLAPPFSVEDCRFLQVGPLLDDCL